MENEKWFELNDLERSKLYGSPKSLETNQNDGCPGPCPLNPCH